MPGGDLGDHWILNEGDREVLTAFMYLSFKTELARNHTLLLKVEKRDVLHQVAWLTRNLLELDIWIEFCSKDEKNARQFWEDAIRDAFSLLVPGEEHDPGFEQLLQKASGLLTPGKPRQAWTAVGRAAKALGRDDYPSQSQWLSKFVHPTAISILLPLQPQNRKSLARQFAGEGNRLYVSAIEKLDGSSMAAAFRKHRPGMEGMRKAYPLSIPALPR